MNWTPMLPTEGTSQDISNPRYCAQYKYDGSYVLVHKEDDKVTLTTRRGNEYSHLYKEICDTYRELTSPYKISTHVAELTFFDDYFKDVFLPIHTTKEVWEKYQLHPALVIHDLYQLDKFYYIKREYQFRFSHIWEKIGSWNKSVFTAPTMWTLSEKERLWKFVTNYRREGVVLKDGDSLVEAGRSNHWLKVKLWQGEKDLTIIGYTRGEGSRTNLGAILLGLQEGKSYKYLGKCGVPSEEDRDFLLHNLKPVIHTPIIGDVPGDYIPVQPDLKVEITHMGMTPQGIYRMPQLKRVRDDI